MKHFLGYVIKDGGMFWSILRGGWVAYATEATIFQSLKSARDYIVIKGWSKAKIQELKCAYTLEDVDPPETKSISSRFDNL